MTRPSVKSYIHVHRLQLYCLWCACGWAFLKLNKPTQNTTLLWKHKTVTKTSYSLVTFFFNHWFKSQISPSWNSLDKRREGSDLFRFLCYLFVLFSPFCFIFIGYIFEIRWTKKNETFLILIEMGKPYAGSKCCTVLHRERKKSSHGPKKSPKHNLFLHTIQSTKTGNALQTLTQPRLLQMQTTCPVEAPSDQRSVVKNYSLSSSMSRHCQCSGGFHSLEWFNIWSMWVLEF